VLLKTLGELIPKLANRQIRLKAEAAAKAAAESQPPPLQGGSNKKKGKKKGRR